MAFTEDLSAFFNADDFAVVAVIDGASVKGIFDRAYYESGDGMVSGSQPQFVCVAADAPNAAAGQPVIVSGGNYKIAGPPEADGTGLVLLRLEKQ